MLFSCFWERSLNLASQGNFDRSIEMLRKCELLVPRHPEKSFLKGFILIAQGRDKEGAAELVHAMHLLSGNSRLNSNEKKYLRVYATGLIEVIGDSYDSAIFYRENFQLDKVKKA